MSDMQREIKTIKVRTAKHKNSDLLLAFSDDLPGLLVPGRSNEEIKSKMPAAISEILEASGVKVVQVEALEDVSVVPDGFVLSGFVARAELESA